MEEEDALTISAQRLDGYEVPGINEEIDKVKPFSLHTFPVRVRYICYWRK